jgi:pimeloyl-ACP methyl ester carboxylesterase
MGLGFQMVAWPDAFCEQLAARGLRVIRFDNRDAGRSTHIDGGHVPTRRELITRKIRNPAYTLEDMAADSVGLLDALGIERAHIVGASMGGMIAQTVAARYPERVLSLTSIMSTTGSAIWGQPAPKFLVRFLAPPPVGREAYLQQTMETVRLIRSPGFPPDEEASQAMLELTWDRGVAAGGLGRQLGAILASGNRTKALRTIKAPTVVVHGAADRLVRPSGGRATARAIPGAELVTVEGMGHDLPAGAWPQVLDAISRAVARAGAAPATART